MNREYLPIKQIIHKATGVFFVALFLLIYLLFFSPISQIAAQDLDELRGDIENRKEKIEELKRKIGIYESNIEKKREESETLENQLDILDEQIQKNGIELEAVSTEVETLKLQLQENALEIDQNQIRIDRLKNQLSELIRVIYKSDQASYLEILLANDSFSEFFEEVKRLKTVQKDVHTLLEEVVVLKEDLKETRKEMEVRQFDLKKLKAQQEGQQQQLLSQQIEKDQLLEETNLSEKKYQDLLYQLRKEQNSIETEIQSLEKEIRKRLEAESGTKPQLSSEGYNWPIASRIVTAKFHDPDYPYRNIFEHPAIDIATGQGTPVKAVADGYVGRAKDNGMGYSYIMLLHDDGISTVYGHISKIYVSADEYVKQGDVIGLSGGAPGTPGAGRLTTGPHLHLEFRHNGIPVNPLHYLE